MGVSNSLHHKYAIADANIAGSNPVVLTGSHNWSNNAENNSDENTIIIYDGTIANIYLQEFEKRWAELGGGANFLDELIDIELLVFPNPSFGKVTVKSSLEISKINLYAVDGKLLSVYDSTTIHINSSGVYFIKIITEEGNLIKKIIIE